MARVRIEILSNVRARIVGASKETLKYLDESLSETQKGSEWSPRHRRFGGRWDGKRHHFHISPTFAGVGTFPKGLMQRVQTLLANQQIKVKLSDKRKRVLPEIDLSDVHAEMLEGVSMDGMYSFQLEAVKSALVAQSGIIFIATNGGKTSIAAAMIKVLDRHTILFVVPKAILLKQAREDIASRLGTVPETIGVIGGGRFEPKEITVAIINSVTPSRKSPSQRAKHRNVVLREYLKTVDVVFLDEGHHAKATTWFRLMSALTNAQFRYLMSGTPFTGNNDLMVEAATGPIICEVRNDALIKLGVSAKPTVRMIAITKPDLSQFDDQSWNGIYKAGIVNNIYRNKIIARIADQYAADGKAVLILVRQLNQGSQIRALVKASVEFAHGKMHELERDRLVDWFKTADGGRVLVASSILDEGVDVPNVNALIIADGGESLRATLQKIGRSVRRKKKGANVVDAVDFADETHHWLSKHALERYDIYAGESFDIVEEELDDKGRPKTNKANGTKTVQALSREANGRGKLLGSGGYAHGGARNAAGISAEEFQWCSEIMYWRWRQAERLD